MSYCRTHEVNNCIECAIAIQTSRLELALKSTNDSINIAMINQAKRTVYIQSIQYRENVKHNTFLRMKAIADAKRSR